MHVSIHRRSQAARCLITLLLLGSGLLGLVPAHGAVQSACHVHIEAEWTGVAAEGTLGASKWDIEFHGFTSCPMSMLAMSGTASLARYDDVKKKARKDQCIIGYSEACRQVISVDRWCCATNKYGWEVQYATAIYLLPSYVWVSSTQGGCTGLGTRLISCGFGMPFSINGGVLNGHGRAITNIYLAFRSTN